MRAGTRLGWRLATVLAFGVTAVLAVTLSRGVPASTVVASAGDAGHAQPGATARCTVSGLRISVSPGAHLTGVVTRYAVEFTNVSRAACTLTGYPQVAAYRGDHVQVGEVAAYDTSVAASRIMLAPGQTAHASLDASLPPAKCRLVRAAGLRIVVSPGDSVVRYVRRPLTACAAGAAKGQDYLHVRAIQPGTGEA
jgi:Protein of unknown function (DUF4232)